MGVLHASAIVLTQSIWQFVAILWLPGVEVHPFRQCHGPYRDSTLGSEVHQTYKHDLGWSQILQGPSSWLETCKRLAELVWNWSGIHELIRCDFIGCHQNVYQKWDEELSCSNLRLRSLAQGETWPKRETRRSTAYRKICKCCLTEAWLELLYHRQPRALLSTQFLCRWCFLNYFVSAWAQRDAAVYLKDSSRFQKLRIGGRVGLWVYGWCASLCAALCGPRQIHCSQTTWQHVLVSWSLIPRGLGSPAVPRCIEAGIEHLSSCLDRQSILRRLLRDYGWTCGPEQWLSSWHILQTLTSSPEGWNFDGICTSVNLCACNSAAGCGYVERGLHAGRDGPSLIKAHVFTVDFLPTWVMWTAITQVAGKPILRGRCHVCHLRHGKAMESNMADSRSTMDQLQKVGSTSVLRRCCPNGSYDIQLHVFFNRWDVTLPQGWWSVRIDSASSQGCGIAMSLAEREPHNTEKTWWIWNAKDRQAKWARSTSATWELRWIRALFFLFRAKQTTIS